LQKLANANSDNLDKIGLKNNPFLGFVSEMQLSQHKNLMQKANCLFNKVIVIK